MKLMDDNEFLESYLSILEEIEGKEGGDTTTDIPTGYLGIVNTLGIDPADYPNNPRGLAKAVAEKNIQELKRIGVNWDELPLSMKYNALDMQFNFGSLNVKAKNYLANLKAGNYAVAINETLDALSASDPRDGKQRPVKGIALRRAKFYNLVASDIGVPTITSVDAVNQDNAQKSAKFTYGLDDGNSIVKPFTVMSLHSRSVPGFEKVLGFEEEVDVKPTGEPLPETKLDERGIAEQTKSAFPATGDEQYLDQEGPIRDTGTLVEPEESRGILDRIKDFIIPDTDEEKRLKKIRAEEPETLDLPEELSEARDFSVLRKMYQDKKFNEGGLSLSEQMDTIQDPAVKQAKRRAKEPTTDKTDLEKLKDVAKFGAEFIPGVGEAMAVKRVSDAIDEKDYVGAGIETAAGALGLIPVVGDMAGKGLRVATKSFRKADTVDETVDTMTASGLNDADIKSWRKSKEEGGNATSEEFRKSLKGRNPILIELAEARKANEITAQEYREAADAFRPIRTVEKVPEPATTKEVVSALGKKSEKGVVGVNRNIPDGDKITARLDINAYTDYDVWIPTLTHPEKKTMYSPTVVLQDVSFIQPDDKAVGMALNVATGKAKAPFAVMEGNYRSISDSDAFEYAKQVFDDESWTQVGYDPTRRGFFYDRKTGNPVLNAEEVVQVGHLVLAKNAVKGNVEDFFYNKGGAVPMKEQMSMFDDGGLMDEGNTIDPISGNDVPPGSTQEEVRDDIPAQLSEGEFVFPADVVRYIGLEKLMQMRQQAKMGLQTMDDMGQMGNSEEAVMPDNLPFELSDLDMDDDPVEMNTGGVAGVSTVPSQVPATSFVQAPPPATTMPIPPTPTPTPAPVPVAPTYTPPTQQAPPIAPNYSELVYKDVMSTPESAPQLVEIINPTTGEKRSITYIPGVTQLPEGFVLASEYTAPETQATSVTPVAGQAQTRDKDDGGPSDKTKADMQRYEDASFYKEMLGLTDAKPFSDIFGDDVPGTITATGYIIGDNNERIDPITLEPVFFGKEGIKYALNPDDKPPLNIDLEGGINRKIQSLKDFRDESSRLKRENQTKEMADEYFATGEGKRLLDKAVKDKEEADAPPTRTPKQQAAMDAFNKQVAEARAIEKQKKEDKKDRDKKIKELEEETKQMTAYEGGIKKGGLLTKTKPKPKQMRSGGLASR